MFKVKRWLFLYASYLNKLVGKKVVSNLLFMVIYAKNCVCANIFLPFVNFTLKIIPLTRVIFKWLH